MANLIPMEQAASMLGVSVAKLTEMRSNNEIFGYRDGQNWKFKMSELERVATELGVTINLSPKGPALELEMDDEELALELSDSSLEISSADLSSEVDDIDSLLGDSGELLLEESGELQLSGGSDLLALDDEVIDGDDDDVLSFGSSDISLAAGSSKNLTAGDTGDLLAGTSDVLSDAGTAGKSPSDTGELLAGASDVLADVEPTGQSPSDTGAMLAAASDLSLSGDDLSFSDDDDLFADDLELSDSSFEDSVSDFEDSDLVLDDSDSSEEFALDAGESGLSLDASESGLSLIVNESGIDLDEEPFELGGSDIDSLELPEDDEDLILDEVGSEAMMAPEDEFKLTALEEDLDDQSSGSQVIALEDSEIYTDEEPTLLTEAEDLTTQPAMLPSSDAGYPADGGSVFDHAGGMGPAAVGVAGMAGAGAMTVPVATESPFSLLMVLGLAFVALLLLLGGMIGYDLARNLWMAEDQIVNSGILKFFLELFRMA